jgi:hypothetical protein
MTDKPLLIRRTDVPDVYGLSERQLKRKVFDGDLSHVHPSGPTGPCFLMTAELDDLIARSTVRARRKSKRAS